MEEEVGEGRQEVVLHGGRDGQTHPLVVDRHGPGRQFNRLLGYTVNYNEASDWTLDWTRTFVEPL